MLSLKKCVKSIMKSVISSSDIDLLPTWLLKESILMITIPVITSIVDWRRHEFKRLVDKGDLLKNYTPVSNMTNDIWKLVASWLDSHLKQKYRLVDVQSVSIIHDIWGPVSVSWVSFSMVDVQSGSREYHSGWLISS